MAQGDSPKSFRIPNDLWKQFSLEAKRRDFVPTVLVRKLVERQVRDWRRRERRAA